MSAFDLSSLVWPDAAQRRQPQGSVKLRQAFAGGVAFIGANRIDAPEILPQKSVANPGIFCGEREVNASPTSTPTFLGSSSGSHIIVVRLRGTPAGYWNYWLSVGSTSLALSPSHSNYNYRFVAYDGTFRDSGITIPTDYYATVVVRFSPGETAFFTDGVKANSTGRTEKSGTWQWYDVAGNYLHYQSLLAWVPGAFSDADCIRISDEPYSALFEPVQQVGFDFPASAGGAITLTGLIMGNFTSSGARATVGITR